MPVSVDKAPTEPLEPQAGTDEELEMEDDSDGEGEGGPAAGDFAFLGAAPAETEDDSSEESEADEPAGPPDENLEDFFKGLK
jgi:hypothetical protein